MDCLVRLVLTCERPDVELRQLEQRLPLPHRSCRHRLQLCNRHGIPLLSLPAAEATAGPGDAAIPGWIADLPHGCSLAYERLEELLEQLERATAQGAVLVLLGWRRELSLWRHESCRPQGPLQHPVDPFWLELPLPPGAVLQRLDGPREATTAALPELALSAALEAREVILRLPAPFLLLRFPVPGTASQRKEWIRIRDRAISSRRGLHGWSPRLELELRRHGRWLMAWTAAERQCWEEALHWWQRGTLQLPGSRRRNWFEALKLFCRAQNEQPGPVRVGELLGQPLWRRQGLACLGRADAPLP